MLHKIYNFYRNDMKSTEKYKKRLFKNMIVISLTCLDLAIRTHCMTVIAVFDI